MGGGGWLGAWCGEWRLIRGFWLVVGATRFSYVRKTPSSQQTYDDHNFSSVLSSSPPPPPHTPDSNNTNSPSSPLMLSYVSPPVFSLHLHKLDVSFDCAVVVDVCEL